VLYGRADWRAGTYTFVPPPTLFSGEVTVTVTDPRDGTTAVSGKKAASSVTGTRGSSGITDPRDGTTKVTGTSSTGKVS